MQASTTSPPTPRCHIFAWPGERTFILLSAGNLATTQMVVKRLWSDIESNATVNLRNVVNMLGASDYIASISAGVQKQHAERDTASTNFEATFIFGGQIGTAKPETMLIYPQGNYIHESDDHPFMQIGEVKYGKPISTVSSKFHPAHPGGPLRARLHELHCAQQPDRWPSHRLAHLHS